MMAIYPWIKTLHLLSIIIWFSGMIWLPRLLLRQRQSNSPEAQALCAEMALRIQRLIVTPAMLLALVFGTALVVMNPAWLSQGWLHTKLLMVVALTGFHGWLAASRRKLSQAETADKVSVRSLQLLTWLPLAALALIVALVIVKPF